MHPILAQRDRLTIYMAAWLPLAAMLALMLVLSAGSGWIEAVVLAVPLATIYAFVCLAAWYPCRALPLRGTSIAKTFVTHLATAAVSASLWSVVAVGLAKFLDRKELFPGADARTGDQLGLLITVGVLLYLLAVTVHYLLVAFEASREAERRALRAEVGAKEAELRALRAQVDPHFLFNSLNSISSLVKADPDGARTMCVQLGDLLRASLRLGTKKAVTLGEELANLDLFLGIERTRFGDRLHVESEVDDDCLSCPVPPLVLQPLVENALKHGISGLIDGGTVCICGKRRPGCLTLTVENPFDPVTTDALGAGIGLANLRQRLHGLYGDAARLEIGAINGVFRVQVVVPIDDEETNE